MMVSSAPESSSYPLCSNRKCRGPLSCDDCGKYAPEITEAPLQSTGLQASESISRQLELCGFVPGDVLVIISEPEYQRLVVAAKEHEACEQWQEDGAA